MYHPSRNATQPSCPQANLTFHHLTLGKAPILHLAWAISASTPHYAHSPIILTGWQVDFQVT